MLLSDPDVYRQMLTSYRLCELQPQDAEGNEGPTPLSKQQETTCASAILAPLEAEAHHATSKHYRSIPKDHAKVLHLEIRHSAIAWT